MATKFGYIERQATNNINWNAIGKQVVSNLQLEAQVRQEKKDAIDAASREAANNLQNAPQGESLTINEFTLDYANDAQQLLLQQDKLLKAGLLNPRDYAVVRANLNESTNTMYALSKEYQEEYERKMERYKNLESAELEAFQMESVEGLANINSSKALINPDSGVVSIGLWQDGSMDGDPSSYATVNELRNRIKSEYDRFNSNEEVASNVQTLGGYEWVDVIKARGGGDINQVISNMDQTQREGYEDWEKNVISSMTSNPFNVASMLTDEIDQTEEGVAFRFVWDKEEFDNDETGTVIFLDRSKDPTGVPVMQDSQLEIVDEYLKNKVRNQLKVEQDIATSSRAHRSRDPNAGANRSRDERQSDAVNLFGQLWYGNAEEKEAAAQSLRGLNRDITSIDASGANGIVITYKDGTQEPISYGTDQARFIERGVNFALATGDRIDDVTKAVERSSIDDARTLNTSTFESRGIAAPEEVSREELNSKAATDLYGVQKTFFRDQQTQESYNNEVAYAVEQAEGGNYGLIDALYKREFGKFPEQAFGEGELD